MADKNTYISLHGVGQWLPIAPCGAVIVLDRGVEYGTSYELNCLTGDIRYTPGSIDGFRFIIASTNVYGGGDAPVTRQDYAVWGPNEKFPVATLRGDMGQGLRNSSLLTRNPFGFLSQYKEYTNGTFISCWKSLYDFNRSWTVWDDWFIPSREELMNLVNQTTSSGGSNLFGFIKRGWVEASSEYTADYGKADSALLTDGSEGSGAQKSSQSYGRLYFKYIGGTGYEGFNGSTALPAGVTGSIPLGYESVSFKRLLSQSGTDTLAWGNSANLNTYLTQEAITYLSGMTNGMAIGEGCKISMLLSLGSGISLGSGVLESTAYIGDNLFLFSNRISTQANIFGSLPLSRIGFREKSADGAELLPFIPSRDELITILNNSRGKGLFTEGEEFWSVSDASATQAYSVTYHEASEPTVNTRDKTTGLKCLVCRWNPSLSDLPKVEDPVLSIVDVPLFDITVVQPEGGTLTVNPTQQLEAGTPVFVYISTSIANNKFGTLSVTTAGGSAVGFTTIGEGRYTFTMPSDNVTVSCTFTQVEKPVTYFAYQRAPDNAYVVVYNEFLPIWFVSIDPDSDVIWGYTSDMVLTAYPYLGDMDAFDLDSSVLCEELGDVSIVLRNGNYYIMRGSRYGISYIEQWDINTGEVIQVNSNLFTENTQHVILQLTENPDRYIIIPSFPNNDDSICYWYYTEDLISGTVLLQNTISPDREIGDIRYLGYSYPPLRLGDWTAICAYRQVWEEHTDSDGNTSLTYSRDTSCVMFFNIVTKEFKIWELDTTGVGLEWTVVDNRFYIYGYTGTGPDDMVPNSGFYYYIVGASPYQFLARERANDIYKSSFNMSDYTDIRATYNLLTEDLPAIMYKSEFLDRYIGDPEATNKKFVISNPVSKYSNTGVYKAFIGYYEFCDVTLNKSDAIAPGETITVTLASNDSDYPYLSALYITNCTTGEAVSYTTVSTNVVSFTMPSSDVQIEAKFDDVAPCLDADSLITLADGSYKKFRDLSTDDEILVWDFDNGCYATAPLLWKHEPHTALWYWLMKTDTGREIKIIRNHRFFSPDLGRFERATNLKGHTIWTEEGMETVVSCTRVNEPVEYCNAISFYHMNVIAGGFLTSCGFNNIYPIEDMRYQYDKKRSRGTNEAYWEERGVPGEWFKGMRIDEQYSPDDEIIRYVKERTE